VFGPAWNRVKERSLLHSSFRDAHKGRVFIIYFEAYSNGFTSRLEIEGLPPRKYADKIWKDREQAKIDVSNDARQMIDDLRI
jgi:hypothetical protein